MFYLTDKEDLLYPLTIIYTDCVYRSLPNTLPTVFLLRRVGWEMFAHFHPNGVFCLRDLLCVGLSTDILYVEIFKLTAELIKF